MFINMMLFMLHDQRGERTLQMLVPEVKPESVQKKYPAILYVQGSAWLKQDQYKRLSAMADLARRGFVTAILQYRESDLATFSCTGSGCKNRHKIFKKTRRRISYRCR